MAIALVQDADAQTSDTAGSTTATFGSVATGGNLLVVVASCRTGAFNAGVATPDGYTAGPQYWGPTFDGGGARIFYKVAAGGETGVTVVKTGSYRADVWIGEYSGATIPVADSAVTNVAGASTSLTAGPVTATDTESLVIGAFVQSSRNGTPFTAGAGYTLRHHQQVFTSGPCVAVVDKFAAAGTYSPAVTSSESDGYGSAAIVFPAGATPPPPPKVSFSVNDVEFTNLLTKEIRVELNGTGAGHFSIARGDAQATAENLARGNVVKVSIPEIHDGVLFEFFIEEGDFELLSSDEEGGQELRFAGPGTLSVLRRAVVAYEEYLDGTGNWKPNKGRVVFDDGVTEGHIVNKLIREAQAAGRPSDPIPMVTKTFNATDDSNGDPWGDEVLEGKWRVPMGAVLYDEIIRLVRGGLLSVEMTPDFMLNLYRTQGVDRTSGTFGAGKVRFVGGVNIADELVRGMAGRDFATHAYIRYDGGWTDAAKIYGAFPYEQEIFHDAGETDTVATARRAARGEMGWRETVQESLLLSHIVPWPGDGPDDDAGLYLPGPTWSDHGRYWPGDLVTVHTGTGEHDYNNATHRVYAITLRADETGYLAPPIVELNAPFLSADGASSGLSASPIAGSITGGSKTVKVDLTAYQQEAEKGQADGYASLDGDALVPIDELPVGTGSDEVAAGDHTHSGAPLSNYAATTDPTVNEDTGDGYATGSRWVNTTTDEEFVCTDASAGAAVWVSTTAQGLGSGDVASDAIWDAAGDLAVGTGSNSAARLAAGSEGDVLTISSGVPSWEAPSSGGTFSGCRAYRSTTQSVGANTATQLLWDSERYDTDGYHDTSTNTDRLVPPANGYYRIGGCVDMGAAFTYIAVKLNGTTYLAINPGPNSRYGAVATEYYLTTSDYVTIEVYSSQARTVSSTGNYSNEGWISRIG